VWSFTIFFFFFLGAGEMFHFWSFLFINGLFFGGGGVTKHEVCGFIFSTNFV